MRNKKQDREKPLILSPGKLQEKRPPKLNQLKPGSKVRVSLYNNKSIAKALLKGKNKAALNLNQQRAGTRVNQAHCFFCFKFSESETKQCQTTEEPQTQKNRPE